MRTDGPQLQPRRPDKGIGMRHAAAVIAVIACLILLVVFVRGCDDPIPSAGWVSDLHVLDGELQPIESQTATRVGEPIDVVVSFVPGTSRPEAFPDRPLLPAENWRVRAEVLDEDGMRITDRPPGGLYDEMLEFDWMAVEYLPKRQGAMGEGGTSVWVSPEPPEEMKPGTRYLWARVPVPSDPGTYALVVRLYPAADPPRQGHLNPEFGPPVTLWESTLEVAPGEPRSSRIVTQTFDVKTVPRKVYLLQFEPAES
jgi:hypothetical protein